MKNDIQFNPSRKTLLIGDLEPDKFYRTLDSDDIYYVDYSTQKGIVRFWKDGLVVINKESPAWEDVEFEEVQGLKITISQ